MIIIPALPGVETGTDKGTDRQSAAEMKPETGERLEKGRAERMAGTIDGDFTTGDSVFFCLEVSVVEGFCVVRWSVTLMAAGLYYSIRRRRHYTRLPRRGCNS
jgi:hypothetical protein